MIQLSVPYTFCGKEKARFPHERQLEAESRKPCFLLPTVQPFVMKSRNQEFNKTIPHESPETTLKFIAVIQFVNYALQTTNRPKFVTNFHS